MFLPCLVAAFVAGEIQAQDSVGSQQRVQKISELEGGFGGSLNTREFFGVSTANIGDIDNDGNVDLAIGTRGKVEGMHTPGAVWILFLNSDGTVRDETKIDAGTGGGTPGAGNFFGTALAGLGDLDGDGVEDIAVGDPEANDGGPMRGMVSILFLEMDGSVKSEVEISSTAGAFSGPLDDRDLFGYSLAAMAPSTPGAVLDLAVGAVGDDDGGLNRGAVWLLSLAADGTILGEKKISETSGGFGGGLANGDAFGTSIASIDDIDGDGENDLVVGAELDDDGDTNTGAVWILFRAEDGTIKGEQKISDDAGGFDGVLFKDQNFGSGVATIGDLDQDGVGDVAVGAPGTDDGGKRRGAVWFLFLNTDGTVRDALKLSDDDPGFEGTLSDADYFGSSLGFIADLDGNGLPEIIAGAPGDDDGGFNKGAAYIVFFQFPDTIVNPGSGINPVVFVQGTTSPHIGTKWDPLIDLDAPPGGVSFHVVGVSSRRQVPMFSAAGGSTVVGELLISIADGDLQLTQMVMPGENFAIPIPDDVSLIGLECFAQGVIIEPSMLTLTNGLDIIVGFPPGD